MTSSVRSAPVACTSNPLMEEPLVALLLTLPPAPSLTPASQVTFQRPHTCLLLSTPTFGGANTPPAAHLPAFPQKHRSPGVHRRRGIGGLVSAFALTRHVESWSQSLALRAPACDRRPGHHVISLRGRTEPPGAGKVGRPAREPKVNQPCPQAQSDVQPPRRAWVDSWRHHPRVICR